MLVWTEGEFAAAFGTPFNNRVFVGFSNGDGKSCAAHVEGATSTSGIGVYAVFDTAFSGGVRLNYLVAIPA